MQKKAVFHTEGPLLVLAGAGSGKTRVLTHRAAYLIEEKGVDPYNILAITFTNKAAGEMRERIDRIAEGGARVWVSTFHSLCVRILRRHIELCGFKENFSIYDADDQKKIVKEVVKKLNINTKLCNERTILNRISSWKDKLIKPEEAYRKAAGQYGQMQIADAYGLYQETLKKNNALDFDDLIMKTVELFDEHPEVLDIYSERFKYIMVDEYQDTNTAQFNLVERLARRHGNICVVGDDDQSIYKFRGADIENILSFETTFKNAAVIKLEQNYRSTSNILNVANEIIKNNDSRRSKKLWTGKGSGRSIEYYQLEDAKDEAALVAGNIKRGKAEGRKFSDFACLYRTNAQSRALEEGMMNASIPYKIVGGVNFFSRKEIKDILAYLKTIDNGEDDLSVKRILNVPRRDIGQTSEARIDSFAAERGISFFDALLRADEAGVSGQSLLKIKKFTDEIGRFRLKAAEASIRELVEDVINKTGYVEAVKKEETKEKAVERIENINELITKCVEYDESAETPTLGGFLEEVSLVADIDSLEMSNDYVALMTVHSAKGLEFPCVFLCGMEDGLFPGFASMESTEDLEEERRLCYVAVTRAMEELTITCAKKRMVRGETYYAKVSRFVEEIPAEYLDVKTNFGRYEKEKFGGPGRRAGHEGDRGFSSGMKNQSSGRRSFGEAVHFKGYGGAGASRQADYGGAGASRQAGYGGTKTPYQTGYGEAKMPSYMKGSGLRKPEKLEYGVGDRVRHIKFGEGTVKEIADGGRDFEVTVDFDRAGTRKMFSSFARLKKM